MLRAEALGKRYDIYARPIDGLKELLFRRSYHKTFWALRNVNFHLVPGESLGVIGENGAGKSTLLKLMAGTLQPSCGSLESRGRVSAILELGSGFHPELTGEENIRIGCAVLGLSPDETNERFPSIVDFSELGDFIYRPVKTYSSGMYVRLAFSVVSSVDPDILIIDEALAVGDQHFQKKCMDRIARFREQGKTIVFCSHTPYFVEQVCSRCLWLRDGEPRAFGATKEVLEDYQDYERSLDAIVAAPGRKDVRTLEAGADDPVGGPHSENEPSLSPVETETEASAHPPDLMARPDEPVSDADPVPDGDAAEVVKSSHTGLRGIGERPGAESFIEAVEIAGDLVEGTIETGKLLRVNVLVHLSEAARDDSSLMVGVVRNDGVVCIGASTKESNISLTPLGGCKYGMNWVVPNLLLLSGEYEIHLVLWDSNGLHAWDWARGIRKFRVRSGTGELGLIRTDFCWENPLPGIAASDDYSAGLDLKKKY